MSQFLLRGSYSEKSKEKKGAPTLKRKQNGILKSTGRNQIKRNCLDV